MADRLISCDDRMDLRQRPADSWTTRLPASALDRAPLGVTWLKGAYHRLGAV